MRILLKGFKKDFIYTWEHKKAFVKLEKELTGKITIGGLLHDMDKLFLYTIFTKKEVSKIHRKYSKHHIGNHKREIDIIHAVIDWESARYTKPDKPETAREYLNNFIPKHKKIYEPILKSLKL